MTITWQTHVDHVYKVYCSPKNKQSQLPSQDITTLSITEDNEWADMPLLWCGQMLNRLVHAINPLPEQTQQ